jgi:hypothetical protein
LATDDPCMFSWRRPELLAVLSGGVYRVLALVGVDPVRTPDTADYLRQASLPLSSTAFWGAQHPPLLPLLWKFVPASVYLNGVVAGVCWGLLALTLAELARTTLVRWAVLASVLGLSLAPEVSGWDTALLSESISLSLAALALALTIRFARTPSAALALAMGSTILAATLTRDTMLPLLLLATAPAALAGRRNVRILAACAAVAIGFSAFGQTLGHRSEIPTRNAIGMAMLSSPADAAWFRARKIPGTPALLLERPRERFQRDPRTAHLRRWLDEQGRTTWLSFLATHPARTLHIDQRLDIVYDPPRLALALYWNGGNARGWYPHGLLLTLLALAGVAGAWSRRRTRDGLVLVSFAAATFPVAVLIWDLDAFEFARHAAALPVLVRVSLVSLALLAAEPVYERARNAALNMPKYARAS